MFSSVLLFIFQIIHMSYLNEIDFFFHITFMSETLFSHNLWYSM